MADPMRKISDCENAQKDCRKTRLYVLISAVGVLVLCGLTALAWAGVTRDRLAQVETKVTVIEERLGTMQTDIHDGFNRVIEKLSE